jgi:hypothetical protein
LKIGTSNLILAGHLSARTQQTPPKHKPNLTARTSIQSDMTEKSDVDHGAGSSTLNLSKSVPASISTSNQCDTIDKYEEKDSWTIKDELAGWQDIAKRAQAGLWAWEKKFADVIKAYKKNENDMLQGMASILNERDRTIKELSANEYNLDKTQSKVIKTLERKIRQMHRASLDQKSLIRNLQIEIERRNKVIDQLEFEKEGLMRDVSGR